MIPRFQTTRLKATGNRTNFFVPCRVIPPYFAVDDGLCTGFAQHMPIENLSEVHCPLACRIARTICVYPVQRQI